jgi:hypothetical protein
MTATIYVTKEAWDTSQALKDLDYYDRCVLSDESATDPTGKEGYYLKNAGKLCLATLPDADIVLRLLPSEVASYSAIISAPPTLRGCIFEKSQCLPDRYAEIIRYWTGETLNSNVANAAYYQQPAHAYQVDLSALYANPDLYNQRQSTPEIDALISEGVVFCITGVGKLVANAADDAFVEIAIPIDERMVGLDNGQFMTGQDYDMNAGRAQRIFLRVSDIRNSPDPDRLYLDILRYEELDYGFYY